MKLDYQKTLIYPDKTIRDAIEQLNVSAMRILLVVEEDNTLLGTVTDGDIRRGILKEIAFSESLQSIMNKNCHYLNVTERENANDLMRDKKINSVPLVDEENRVVDLVLHTEYFREREVNKKDNRVFILAGGKGTRLSPVTNILPKPLIPIGETPILELIMRQWQRCGFNRFTLSLNYKADMIKAYFDGGEGDFDLDYVVEDSFQGTAGSLALIKDDVHGSTIVTNCDVFLDIDFDDLFEFHQQHDFDVTLVGVVRHLKIPYGVIDMTNGKLQGMREKPEYKFVVNAGIYILEPGVIELIEDGKYLDMPDLIERARKSGLSVGVFPVSSEMVDVGHWEEYEKARHKLKGYSTI